MPKILTTEPNSTTEGTTLVSFRRKDTKKQPVKDSDKYRAVEVVSFKLPEAMIDAATEGEMQAAPEVFQQAIAEAFLSAAGEILRSFCDANPTATELDASLLTFDAVVAKMQEQQTSQRLNAEQIGTWYDQSTTAKDAALRYTDPTKGPKQQAALKAKYQSLASNNPGIEIPLAVKMISYIAESDTNNSVCKALLKKLDRLTKETIEADEL